MNDGPQQAALVGPVEDEPGHQADQDGDGDQREIVVGEAQAVAKGGLSEQTVGLVGKVGIDTPNQLDGVFQDEQQGIGDDHHQDLVAAMEEAQQTLFDGQADDDANHQGTGRQQQQTPVGVALLAGKIPAHQRGGRVGTDGIEAAMRHVQHAHDAVNDGHPGRNEKQPGGVNGPVNQDGKKSGHRNFLRRRDAMARPRTWL